MNQRPPDPHAPESQPTRQGRRLIRMLFRSGGESEKSSSETLERDSRAEDSAAWRKPTNHQENIDMHTAVPAPTGKFASLKRKLFPSQNRRHPRNVPPLISPINAPLKTLLPPLKEKGASLSRSSLDRDGDSDPIQENNSTSKIFDQEVVRLKNNEADSREGGPESDSSSAEVDNNWRGRTLIDDDDDRDLESAVEALDLETSIADKTLEEMSQAINDLRAWKMIHEKETQEAINKLEECEKQTAPPCHDSTGFDDPLALELELKRQQQERDREAQTLELRKEAEAYQLECNVFRTALDASNASRVEQALQSSGDSDGLALSRLRNELFQLDVKQRQEALLQELQGADSTLDMNIVDVQAFTGELDAILAQFDSAGVDDAAVEDEDLITPSNAMSL